MKDLINISDADLQAELERRRIERENKALQEQREKNKALLEHLSVPGALGVFQHSRTSCSDDNIANGMGSWRPEIGRTAPRCGKCALLEFVRDQYIPDRIDIWFTINFSGTP